MSHHDSIPAESSQDTLARVLTAISVQDQFRRAIEVCGRFGHVERAVVHFVFDRGWVQPYFHGCKRSMPVPLSCSALETLGVHRRTDLQHAIRRLSDQGIIIRQENGGYLLNRNYRDWLNRDGEPRIRPECLSFIETGRLPHECPPEKPSLMVVDEFPEGQTTDLSAPGADATETILDDSRGCASESTLANPGVPLEAHPGGPDVPLEAHFSSDPQNGSIDRARVARFVEDSLSYSSTLSESEREVFSSSPYVSSLMYNRSGNAETYIHQKKKNLWGSPSRNGVKSASMEPEPIANSTVQADPASSLESPPAAPSTNGCQPASMLMSIPGDVVPDPALWSDLEYMLAKFLPCNHYEQQFSYYKNLYETSVMVGALKRCLLKKKGINNFFYILATMRTWAGPEEEQHYDRDLRPIPPAAVETPGPGAPAAESTNADPYADLMANAPGMFGEWFKDHHVSMSNNPPCKGKPNGKFMDDEDFKRRMAIKARDPDRFVKLSMSYYCPSLIMEREA